MMPFDRAFDDRVGDEVTMAILYQSKFRESTKVRKDLLKAIDILNFTTINSIPLKIISINFTELESLDSLLVNDSINMLFITPVRGIDFDNMFSITQKRQVLTFASVPDYVGSGASVGFRLLGEKPQIIINHSSSKAEGADFNSHLLKLSKVINIKK